MTSASSRGKGPRRGRRESGSFWPYVIAVGAAAVVVAILIVVGLVSRGGDGGGEDGGDGRVIVPSPKPTDIPREGHLLGNSGAPVTIIEYADFQ